MGKHLKYSVLGNQEGQTGIPTFYICTQDELKSNSKFDAVYAENLSLTDAKEFIESKHSEMRKEIAANASQIRHYKAAR